MKNARNNKELQTRLTNASLTCLQASHMGFGMNLRSRVSDLKRAGYDVVSNLVIVGDSYIAEYSLDI